MGGDLLFLWYEDNPALNAGYYLRRTDSLGVQVRWERRYSPDKQMAESTTLLPLPDGGALVGYGVNALPPTSLDRIPQAGVMRVDALGNVVWQRLYGQPYANFRSATPLPDGSYAFGGFQGRAGAGNRVVYDGLVVRLNVAQGDTLSTRRFDAGPADRYVLWSVRPAPNGDLLVGGAFYPQFSATSPSQGWLVRLDSLGRQARWQQFLSSPGVAGNTGGLFRLAQPLADGGLLVCGSFTTPGQPALANYLGVFDPTPGGQGVSTTPRWQRYYYSSTLNRDEFQTISPTGTLWRAGRVDSTYNRRTNRMGVLTRFDQAGVPYVPDWCRQPPRAQPFAQQPTPDSLRLLDASLPGPRYAQLVAWHWELGDGTSYDGPVPPRKQYSPIPPPGTPVRLTVTNNLGCTSTYTLYPWGAPSASQLSRELSQHLSVYPNPATSTATLLLSGLTSSEPVTVELRNALGQLVQPVQQLRPSRGELRQELELSALPSGVYSLRVRTDQGQAVKRLVRQ